MNFMLPEVKEYGEICDLIENERFIVTKLDARLLLVFNKIRNAWHPVRSVPSDCIGRSVPSHISVKFDLLGFYDEYHFGLLLTTADYTLTSIKCELAIIKARNDYESFSLVSRHSLLNVVIDAEVYSCFRDPNSPWLIILRDRNSPAIEIYHIQPNVIVGSPDSSRYLGRFQCRIYTRASCAEYDQKLYIMPSLICASRPNVLKFETNKVMVYDLLQRELRTLWIAGPCPRLMIPIVDFGCRLVVAGRFWVFPWDGGRPNMLDMAALRWVNPVDQDIVKTTLLRMSVEEANSYRRNTPVVPQPFVFSDYSLTARGNLLQVYRMDPRQRRMVSSRPLFVPTLQQLSLQVIHSTVTEEFASFLSDSDVSKVEELVATLTEDRQWKRHRGSEYEIERGTFAYPDYDHGKCVRMKQIISRGALMLGLCSCGRGHEDVQGGNEALVWVFNRARNAWTHCLRLRQTTNFEYYENHHSIKLLEFISDDSFVAIAAFLKANGQPALDHHEGTRQIQLVTYQLSSRRDRAERVASRVLAEMECKRFFDCNAFYDNDKPWLLAVPVDEHNYHIYQVFEDEVVRMYTVEYPFPIGIYGCKDSRVFIFDQEIVTGGVRRLFSFDANGTYPIVEVQNPVALLETANLGSVGTRLWNGCLVRPRRNGFPHLFDVETNEWREAGKRDTVKNYTISAHISSEGELIHSYMDSSMHVTSYWLSPPPLSTLCARFFHSRIRLDWARRLRQSEVTTYEQLGYFLAAVPTGQLYEA